MSLNIGPQYYTDVNTSFVLVDTTFPTNSTAVVYLSSISIPGRIVSVRDSTGGLDANKFITVSTSQDVLFTNSTNSASFNAPYGFITCANQGPRNWAITNTYGFPTQSTPAYTVTLNAEDIRVSTVKTVNVNVSSLTFATGTTSYKVFGTATLTAGSVTVTSSAASSTSLIFIQRASLNGSTDVGNLVVTKGSGSFTITSYKNTGATASDTSIVDWILFNPN